MKKVFLSLFLGVFLLVGAGCGDDRERLYIFNWGDFINPDVIEMFEEEYDIRIIYSTYESNEQMYAAIAVQGLEYDIVVPSDYMIYRMIKEGLLRPLNMDNIPNIANLDSTFLGLNFDPSNVYSLPYKWGTLGITYNRTMVSGPITGWADLWNETYANQIFMYDSERDAMAVALLKLGHSLNTTDPEAINAARDLLIAQEPLVLSYVTDAVKDHMIAGEAALALMYSGCAMFSMGHNPDLNYIIPEEGSNLWINGLAIPHNAPNPEAAELFINFMLRPDIAALNTNYIRFSTPNYVALSQGLIDSDLVAMAGFSVTPEEYARLEVFVDLGEYRDLYTRAFIEVLNSFN